VTRVWLAFGSPAKPREGVDAAVDQQSDREKLEKAGVGNSLRPQTLPGLSQRSPMYRTRVLEPRRVRQFDTFSIHCLTLRIIERKEAP
jgi:hypothetical protein